MMEKSKGPVTELRLGRMSGLRSLCVLILVSILLILPASAMAVTADEYDGPTTYDWITVQHNVVDSSSYIVSIPDSIILSADALSVTGTILLKWDRAPGTMGLVHVRMTSSNDFALKNGSSAIDYTVSHNGFLLSNGATILYQELSERSDLTFATTTENVKAATLPGKHTDVLTFTVDIVFGGGSD